MTLDTKTKSQLTRLATRDRKTRAAAEAAREEFFGALMEARASGIPVRALSELTGISYQRIHELTTVRNRATAAKRAAREQT